MFQGDSGALPPFTEHRPSDEHPRTALEVWNEYMDFREAVVGFFQDGHSQQITDPNEARIKIDEIFYALRRKYAKQSLEKLEDD